MHHLYPLAKGDPLCPLGFHPQVRWPTRCKRCFRDYKEHGGKRKDEEGSLRRDGATASTPSLSSWGSRDGDKDNRRSWASSTNLAPQTEKKTNSTNNDFSNPSSWTSTPDLANLEDDTQANIPTVSLTLPARRQKPIDRTVSDSFSLVKQDKATFSRNDSLAARAKKLQTIKETQQKEKAKRIHVKEVKAMVEEPTNHDVQFLIKVKAKPPPSTNDSNESDDDTISIAGTETTDTTLVDHNESELKEQLESLKQELETTKAKCDRLEREKSDILLRRLAAMETTTSKTTASEVLKLQQKCNELQSQLEDYKDEKKSLALRVKELEADLDARPTAQAAQNVADELRSKLLAAETLCEELMDENEDMKKELRDLEEQMDEMQDNFREDQAVEYTSLKKELEQTTKNCRILSFKLRKTERRNEQLETEKNDIEKKLKEVSGGHSALANLEKIKHLEQELKVANEVSISLQRELETANQRLTEAEEAAKLPSSKKKPPMLGSIGKLPSTDGKVSRESLTRGGSQDDPAQLLRDLQDSLEREADLREQLKFAEEEAQNLRKKVSRIEDDNESLVLQLKKMATQARSRKLSPTNTRLTPEPPTDKDEGISDEEDATELKLLLELSEQEASVLRKKVEETEAENDRLKQKAKELQEKLSTKVPSKRSIFGGEKGNTLQDKKVKVLEDEANELRKKLIEKERDCERLHAELSLSQKRSKGIQKSKSLDLDQQTIDLKRQLQVIEQEAAVLRNKVQSLEGENEKLATENKKLQLLRGTKKTDKSVDKYIDQIASLEVELDSANRKIKDMEEKLNSRSNSNNVMSKVEAERNQLAETLERLKQDAAKYYRNRSPKKVTNLTSKEQLKLMVVDLENEIGEILVALHNSESAKDKLQNDTNKGDYENTQKELADMKLKLSAMERELENEKLSVSKEKAKYEELNKNYKKVKETATKANEERDKLKEQNEKVKSDYQKLLSERGKLENDLSKVKDELATAISRQDELKLQIVKFENLKSDFTEKEKEMAQLRKELEEKGRVLKDLSAKSKKIADLENKLQEAEDKLKKAEKTKREQIRQLESKLEEEKDKMRSKDIENAEMSTKFEDDRKGLNVQIDELDSKIKSLEDILSSKNTLIEQLENSLKKERENSSKTSGKVSSSEKKEVSRLQDQMNKYVADIAEAHSKLDALQKSKKTVEDKLKRTENEFKRVKLNLEKKVAELEIDLQNERKKIEVMKTNQQKEQKNRELELSSLRSKIKTLELNSGAGNKKITEIKQDYQERIEKLEKALESEKQEYEDLTGKYEILEEEHVVTKAKLVMEKETLNNQLMSAKREIDSVESQLQALNETFNSKQDAWGKEKLTLQEKIREFEKKSQEGKTTSNLEKTRLKATLEKTQLEFDQLKREYDVVSDQMEYMRRENDELKRKLDDYDKVSKIQRNISADSSAMESEIRQLTIKLNNAEKMKKADLAQCKMRYESQINAINDELKSLQGQVTRFKRERDTYKHMLEGAQKTIGDLKTSPARSRRESKSSIGSYDELEESRSKIASLEQQISCMEDELSEARLESSKLKTELVSERTTWEVKMSELHSRVNELEEEKVLGSGRTKIAGLRTRMELAWQKEREEQQRLLQETATLARDLRQTLFEVERERDKERLEAKRKQEQLKKAQEEEQEENRKKLTELQCDLLELRDAHAKLRTTNEKLRREKDRQEKEREELKLILHGRRRADLEDERRVAALIDQVESLMHLAPELFGNTPEDPTYTPTPPRRTRGSKSRETSPAVENSLIRDERKPQVQSTMQRLIDATEELKRFQRLNEEDKDRERIRRAMGMRRATSTEHENAAIESTRMKRGFIRNGTTGSSLHRKSLSLEHTMQNEQNIWKGDDDSMSSMQSLDGASDSDTRWSKRDTSQDSRLSGGSTQSESGEKKKKKGIMGKLKKLTKSRSIDDQDPGTFSPTRQLSSRPNSNSDVNEETRASKKDLKERITGIFKRGGSSSRSNSLERTKPDTSSTQRPLMKNENTRASPAFSDGGRSTGKRYK